MDHSFSFLKFFLVITKFSYITGNLRIFLIKFLYRIEKQICFCPCNCYIKQPSLFFEICLFYCFFMWRYSFIYIHDKYNFIF